MLIYLSLSFCTIHDMNIRDISKYIGFFVLALGVLGLLMGEDRLGAMMNINLGLDLVRIVLGGLLIYGAITSRDAAKTALTVFGVAYLGTFLIGMLSPTLFGMLPDGLGILDQLLHLGGGVFALYLALKAPSFSHSK
jgi:hypothetical protein